ncbi:MAG: acetyl-CoA acetyltransferase [Ilumatobacteraceae bacterium]|nr:acetyl-CoA acetyltransferase [Ilumatobacteraceae bacterium]
MTIDLRTPVLIGTGQVLQRAEGLDDARDPVALMVEAISLAASDAGLSSVPNPDAIRVVSLLSWKYGNPAHFIAEHLGLAPRELGLSAMGGNTPQTLVNAASRQILAGEIDLVILTGGETTRTRARYNKAGLTPDWRTTDIAPVPVSEDLTMNMPEELARKIMMPIQIYPLFETALRAQAGRSVADHQVHISELYARFSAVAATNPYAWSKKQYTAEEIRTASDTNRMIGFPYPKLMNSNNDVDMSAALILCSAEKATALGVPRDRWIFPQSGSDAHEHAFISHRNHFYDTPAIELAGRRVLELAGLTINDIDLVDLYSCFPSAVQLGAKSLGLDIDSQLTRTGGLQFAGGPWNNYVMHAIATVANELRSGVGATGLVWANGGYTTKHAFGVYATTPPKNGFSYDYPQDQIDALPRRSLASPADAAGEMTIEGYSVMHDREGNPERSIASCILADGRRAWADTTDVGIGRDMCINEWVGRTVRADDSGTLLA